MDATKWTTEPWELAVYASAIAPAVIVSKQMVTGRNRNKIGRGIVCICMSEDERKGRHDSDVNADFARIVACVNAMAGIDDVEGFVADAKRTSPLSAFAGMTKLAADRGNELTALRASHAKLTAALEDYRSSLNEDAAHTAHDNEGNGIGIWLEISWDRVQELAGNADEALAAMPPLYHSEGTDHAR